MPTALVIAPSKGIKTVQELVDQAKAKPGTFTFASAGVGSTTHLTAERFLLSAGITAIHVPFRGGGFRPEVASRPRRFRLFADRGGGAGHRATAGCWRSRSAPGTAPRRLPDVPTTLEAGFPNSDYVIWLGVFVPAKTPRAIVDRLHDESIKALQSPGLRERLASLDVEPMVDDACRVRRVHQRRSRGARRAGQGGRAEAQSVNLNETKHERRE